MAKSVHKLMSNMLTRSAYKQSNTLRTSAADDRTDFPIKRLISQMNQALKVPHISQRFDWDCGLACVASCAAAFGLEHTIDEISSLVSSRSVWSIDLVLILHKLGLAAELHTLYVGVNPSHRVHRYYAGELDEDAERVNVLYASSAAHCTIQSHSCRDLVDLLSAGCLLIVLCDARFLSCSQCEETTALALDDFKGHYIVLTSVRQHGTVTIFDYVDPSSPCSMCRMPGTFLDRARLQQGTDQDIIIVSKR